MKTIVFLCGWYSLGLALFHLSFWKIFGWREELKKASIATRAMLQIFNLRLIYLFLLVAYLCFEFPEDLYRTPLGRAFLGGMCLFWVGRLIEQFVFLRYRHMLIHTLSVVFLIGAALFAAALWGKDWGLVKAPRQTFVILADENSTFFGKKVGGGFVEFAQVTDEQDDKNWILDEKARILPRVVMKLWLADSPKATAPSVEKEVWFPYASDFVPLGSGLVDVRHADVDYLDNYSLDPKDDMVFSADHKRIKEVRLSIKPFDKESWQLVFDKTFLEMDWDNTIGGVREKLTPSGKTIERSESFRLRMARK
jgi:hypothetical protein